MSDIKTSIPLFLDGLASQIFACGKAINLLKLTNIQVKCILFVSAKISMMVTILF